MCRGAIGRTADGGHTWTFRKAPAAFDEVDLVPGTSEVWATGPPAGRCEGCLRVFRSTDDGRTWRTTGLTALQLSVPDARNGYAIQWDARGVWHFVVTRDGGRTWRERTLPCAYSDVSFVTGRHGWMLCRTFVAAIGTGHEPRRILVTTDGGATWRTAWNALRAHVWTETIDFVRGRGWGTSDLAGREQAAVLVSDISPLRWRPVPLARPSVAESMGIVDFSAVSRNVAFALVRREDVHDFELRRTTDGGRTWTTTHRWSFARLYR